MTLNEYLLDPDYKSLGIRHVLLNMVVNACVSFDGTEYHLADINYVSWYKELVRQLNAEGVTVTLVVLMQWDNNPDIQELIYSEGRAPGHLTYEINTQDEVGKKAWTNIFNELVETFSQSDCHIDNYVLGNEVNQYDSYNYSGRSDLNTNVNVYTDGFVMLEKAVDTYYPLGKVFTSFDHNWTSNETGFSGKAYLDAFAATMAVKYPESDWGVGWHAYAPSLRSTISTSMDRLVIWNSSVVTQDVSTPYVCGSNLNVLTDYLRNNFGTSHHVILSEQGFDASGGHESWQSAYLAYTYYACQFNDMVDGVMFRSYIDNPEESGLRFGLLSGSNTEMYNSSNRGEYVVEHKREAYDVFKYMDTPLAGDYVVPCLETIGVNSWYDIVPQYSGPEILGRQNYSDIYNYDFYKNNNPDLVNVFGNSRLSYLQHFVNYGMNEGRQGNDIFNVHAYRMANQDLRYAYGFHLKEYYLHYIRCGKNESRLINGVDSVINPITVLEGKDYSSVYDFEYYKANNPDINIKYINDDIGALQHFVLCGMREGRSASDQFELSSYKNANADLKRIFGNDNFGYYQHYINYGKNEGRIATGVPDGETSITVLDGVDYKDIYDFEFYTAKYKDIAAVFINDQIGALNHFVNYGMKEGRAGNSVFDVISYWNANQDLRRVYSNDLKKYYMHYMKYGKNEGRLCKGVENILNPNTMYNGKNYADVYNYTYYVNRYRDINMVWGYNEEAALAHFVECGMNEGRRGNEEFSLEIYQNRYQDLRNAFGEHRKMYYNHYIDYGKKEGRLAN